MLPRLARALAGAVLVAGLAACGDGADESAGAAVFDNHCVQCHGAGGRGSLGPELMTVLARYGWTGADDGTLEPALAAVRTVVLEGLRASGRAPMPAFEGRLTETELDALMDHLVAIQTAAG
ncbi:MAG: c-type cytochrome [Nitriliruptoraceae bacterium]